MTLEDLGLPAPSLRFALADDELAALAKPVLLERLLEQGDGEVIFVHGGCLLGHQTPLFTRSMDRFDMEILPALPRDLAEAKSGIMGALEAGLGAPTGVAMRMKATEATRDLLSHWRRWIDHVYVTDPTQSLVAAELKWLRVLPGAYSFVGWSHEPVVALWSDLQPEMTATRLIDTTGFVEYQNSTGPAYSLMERRTHSGSVIDDLSARLQSPWIDRPIRFRSGHQIAPLARTILRAADPLGSRWADPADDTGHDSYRNWLLQEDSRGLPRFAQALYWSRPDLQQSFPPSRTPVVDFRHWLNRNDIGVDDSPRDVSPRSALTRKVARLIGKRLGFGSTLASPRTVTGPLSGINIVGFASAETGLGEAMRSTLCAVRSFDSDVAVLDLSHRIYARQLGSNTDTKAVGTPRDATIFHLNPTELIDYSKDALAYRMTAGRNVGFFFWETEKIPETWYPACDRVDEIWVASTYLKNAFAKVTNKPIHIMGMPVDVPATVEPDRARFGIAADDFVVTYVTDAYSGLERKDPQRAIKAFELAFGPDFEGVHLLLKVGNLEKFPQLRRRLNEEATERPMTIVAEYLGRSELWSLLACSDAYLSLHSSEGFGLTILEAMALGVPPIVTAYGGNMDFTGPDNSLLVGYQMAPAMGGPGNIYAGSGLWADPNLSEAAQHLESLRSNPELGRAIGERARRQAAEFTLEAYGHRISTRLTESGVLPSVPFG
jgi:glycosyltransferase involved in cell wall biosynthesis